MTRENHRERPLWPWMAASALAGGFVAVVFFRNFLQQEKRLSQFIATDYDVSSSAFSRTVSQLLGPPLLEGNSVSILQNGEEIFPAMLEGIRSAQRSITFENFIFSEGSVSDQFAAAFAERALSGVKVHVLQDALGCNCVHGAAMNKMRRAGVELEIFRFFHLTQFNKRTHRKLLIIDGKIGFIGGVGISDDWAGDGTEPTCWRDTQYRVEGPVVAQLQQAFMDNWIATRNCVLHGDDYFPALVKTGTVMAQGFKSSATDSAENARLLFLFSIAAARKSIRIASAYFIPDDLLIRTLVAACERGVQVEVIVPSERIDQQVARYVGRALWGPLLQAGARLYEFQNALMHCKYMVVDECWVSVGSSNLDDRSLRLNEEANLNVLDAEFARQHVVIFEQDKKGCREITLDEWRRRPLKERVISSLGMPLRSQL